MTNPAMLEVVEVVRNDQPLVRLVQARDKVTTHGKPSVSSRAADQRRGLAVTFLVVALLISRFVGEPAWRFFLVLFLFIAAGLLHSIRCSSR